MLVWQETVVHLTLHIWRKDFLQGLCQCQQIEASLSTRKVYMGYASDSSTSSYQILDDEDKKIKLSRDTILPKKLDIPHSKMQARESILRLEEWDGNKDRGTSTHAQGPLAEIPDKIIPSPWK